MMMRRWPIVLAFIALLSIGVACVAEAQQIQIPQSVIGQTVEEILAQIPTDRVAVTITKLNPTEKKNLDENQGPQPIPGDLNIARITLKQSGTKLGAILIIRNNVVLYLSAPVPLEAVEKVLRGKGTDL